MFLGSAVLVDTLELIPRFELERLRWAMHQISTLQQRPHRIFGLSGS